jgi:hypothetical protein
MNDNTTTIYEDDNFIVETYCAVITRALRKTMSGIQPVKVCIKTQETRMECEIDPDAMSAIKRDNSTMTLLAKNLSMKPEQWTESITSSVEQRDRGWVASVVWWVFSETTGEPKEWLDFAAFWKINEYQVYHDATRASLQRGLEAIGFYDPANEVGKTPTFVRSLLQRQNRREKKLIRMVRELKGQDNE